MSKKLEDTKRYVHIALQNNKMARENDHMLYIEVVYLINPELLRGDFLETFKNQKQLGLPSFETVSRCRRKLQAEYEDLRADWEVQAARYENQVEFTDYFGKKNPLKPTTETRDLDYKIH